MLDEKNRLWLTSAVAPFENPDFCKAGSTHPSAKVFPVNSASRHLQMYDPQTKKLTHIRTCYATHHLMFAEDANRTLWTSGGGQVIGWLNTKMFDQTGDEVASQGWTPLIVDTNGNGKRDAWTEPDEPVDPDEGSAGELSVLRRVAGAGWIDLGIVLGFPGAIMRVIPGPNPSETALTEIYELPSITDPKADVLGFSPRGGDVDRNGVMWSALVERTPCELRSPQVQGTSERAESDRTTLPRRMDALSRAAAAVQRGHRQRQCRGQLLHLGRSVRHVGPRRKHADQYRQRLRGAARAEGRQMGGDARPVSHSGSTRSGWTDASTIRRRAGRARDCGPRSARARRSTWKPARARRAR